MRGGGGGGDGNQQERDQSHRMTLSSSSEADDVRADTAHGAMLAACGVEPVHGLVEGRVASGRDPAARIGVRWHDAQPGSSEGGDKVQSKEEEAAAHRHRREYKNH